MKKPFLSLTLLSVAAVVATCVVLIPTDSDAQALVPATISGSVTPAGTRTVTAICSYGIFGSATYTATTGGGTSYTINAAGLPAGSNCVVKVSPCTLSNPIQRTVRIPPNATANFTCSS
jgi:hypothetical protein